MFFTPEKRFSKKDNGTPKYRVKDWIPKEGKGTFNGTEVEPEK